MAVCQRVAKRALAALARQLIHSTCVVMTFACQREDPRLLSVLSTQRRFELKFAKPQRGLCSAASKLQVSASATSCQPYDECVHDRCIGHGTSRHATAELGVVASVRFYKAFFGSKALYLTPPARKTLRKITNPIKMKKDLHTGYQ